MYKRKAPRAALRVVGRLIVDTELPGLHKLGVEIHIIRPRTGDRVKTLDDMADLTMRAAHEQELFPSADWSFIRLALIHNARCRRLLTW